jgi:hypothetical protein
MAPAVRELIMLSLLAGLALALRWFAVIHFSSLFLAAPAQ